MYVSHDWLKNTWLKKTWRRSCLSQRYSCNFTTCPEIPIVNTKWWVQWRPFWKLDPKLHFIQDIFQILFAHGAVTQDNPDSELAFKKGQIIRILCGMITDCGTSFAWVYTCELCSPLSPRENDSPSLINPPPPRPPPQLSLFLCLPSPPAKVGMIHDWIRCSIKHSFSQDADGFYQAELGGLVGFVPASFLAEVSWEFGWFWMPCQDFPVFAISYTLVSTFPLRVYRQWNAPLRKRVLTGDHLA